jgi:hypothetical protein
MAKKQPLNLENLNMGVILDESDLRKWTKALKRITTEAKKQSNEIRKQHSRDYRIMLLENIATQKHMAAYASYDDRYAAWKHQHSSGGYWRLMGDLIQALTSYPVPGAGKSTFAWFSGVTKGVKDSGNKSWFSPAITGKRKEIAFYGGIMEGIIKTRIQHHPARPIFGPTLEEFKPAAIPKAEAGLVRVADNWR